MIFDLYASNEPSIIILWWFFVEKLYKTSFWAKMPKYGNLGPDHQKMKKIIISLFYAIDQTNTLPMSPQPLFNDDFSLRNWIYSQISKSGHIVPSCESCKNMSVKIASIFILLISKEPFNIKWLHQRYIWSNVALGE